MVVLWNNIFFLFYENLSFSTLRPLLKTNPNYYLITVLDQTADIYCQFKNVNKKVYIFINSILSSINNVSGYIINK